MNCLDFKRLALSTPNSDDHSFILHSQNCPDCLKYVGEIRKMDSDLAKSMDVTVPESLVARLQLNQLLEEEASETKPNGVFRRYAIAASFAAALFVSGFMVSSYLGQSNSIGHDYEALLSGVMEHMNEKPLTPVWDVQKANQSVNSHLANYDGKMQFKFLDNLEFSRICAMGKYRGLHAGLATDNGHVTFAYIKGVVVDDILDASYEGHAVRIKPLKEGNLVIISRTKQALEVAGQQLEEAVHWDI